MKVGDILGFTEAGPGTAPDVEGEVAHLWVDGTVTLVFGKKVLSYAPGVIQKGLDDGSVVIVSQD